MKDINNARYISTINQLYRANLDIFYYLWKTAIFKYDEFKIVILEDNAVLIYKIGNIGITIMIFRKAKVQYKIEYNDEKIEYIYSPPLLPIVYDEYKSQTYGQFDNLLYAIYLFATGKKYKTKKLSDLLKYVGLENYKENKDEK